ncbi:MAG: CoA transferase [Dehalococcoidales bacterium]|nr:CoA transferase [Dehalococcoidales bacterium]
MSEQVLEGIKVLDFGWAIAGSVGGKQLADHGARVIRIESKKRLDLTRSGVQLSISSKENPDDKPHYTYYNTSKMSISLNLKHPRSREIIEKLVQWADVVNENFTPGTMAKMGLDYSFMRSIKPDIIMVSSSVYGQQGPLSHEWGVNGTGNALSGRFDLSGWADRDPLEPSNGIYGDAVLPFLTAMAVVAALDYRKRTGKGQYIDASMLDLCIHQVTPAVLEWEINGHLQSRNGNRHPEACPHGIFPCLGEDKWVAITIFTEAEWKSFCGAAGNPVWTKDVKFGSLKSRKEYEDELEQLVGEWTVNHTNVEIMEKLQAAGVPAGIVQDGRDLMKTDEQLKYRKFLVPLKHPVIGLMDHPTPPYKLSFNPANIKTSPCLGEHNEYVCKNILGLSDVEFTELLEQGVFE